VPDSGAAFDAVIVGGGPAGIAAACRVAEAGRRAILLDEGLGPGGQIWRPSVWGPRSSNAQRWISRLEASSAVVHRSTSVFDARRDAAGGFVVSAECEGRPLEVSGRALILATGARERFLPFPGWTLPNVVGVGGAQALLKAGTVFSGRRVVIAGSGPLLLPVAASLAKAGAHVALVAEQAAPSRVRRFAMSLWRRPATLLQAAVFRGAFITTRYSTGTWVVSARGDAAVREVTVTDGATTRDLACDVLCVAFGLVPNVELARLLGCEAEHGVVSVDSTQATSVADVYSAGETTGIGGVDLSIIEGEIAGLAAAGKPVPQRLVSRGARLRRDASMLESAFALRAELRALAQPETVVCRCEDVRLRDLKSQWTARQAKLYARAGMGPCQGRVCGPALEFLMGWRPDSVRPPAQPVRLGSFASELAVPTSTDIGAH
jgi:NADPH-dependent 2,4-dienoyl-CoA reductase/sulfur reductase-like enzyme